MLITEKQLESVVGAYTQPEETAIIMSAVEMYIESLTAAKLPCKTLLPPIDEAGAIAVTICETLILEPKLTAQEQSFFVAGFQECVKYLGGK